MIDTGRAPERGMSLIELLVAVAILGGVAVLSAQLVIQSTKLMETSARASHNPDLVLATEWVRRDLYEAIGVVGGTMGWSDSPLVCMTQNGGWVAIGVVDGRLVRTSAPLGQPTEDRVILNGVEGWRWRVDDGAAVRIEITALANPHAHENLAGKATYRVDRRTERLALALRGRQGGSLW